MFRANTMDSKMFKYFALVVGAQYLWEVLAPYLWEIQKEGTALHFSFFKQFIFVNLKKNSTTN